MLQAQLLHPDNQIAGLHETYDVGLSLWTPPCCFLFHYMCPQDRLRWTHGSPYDYCWLTASQTTVRVLISFLY